MADVIYHNSHKSQNDNEALLKPLPFGGRTVSIPKEPIGGLEESTLQGSPASRIMGPSNMESPSEEKSNMRHDADDQKPDGKSRQGTQDNSDLPDDPIFQKRDIPDPTEIKSKTPTVEVAELTHEEQQRISELVSAEELTNLGKQITQLYQEVENNIANSREQSAQAFSWLNDARRIIMGSPGLYTLAELRIHQVRLLLRQVISSNEAAQKYQTKLVSWNLFWLILFMGLFAFDGAITNSFLNQGLVERPAEFTDLTIAPSLVWYFQPWLCILMGGIGGALAAITVLGRTISRREYDPALNLDYYLNTIKGAVLGGVVYYILLGGFVTAVATTTISSDVGEFTQRVQVAGSPLFILMAFIAGFAQQRILALLPQVWGNVTGSGKDKDDTLSVTQSAVQVAPMADSSIIMGRGNQQPFSGSYNGAGVPPATNPAAGPDAPFYADDPSSGVNGQKQDDFVPFPNAGP